VFPKKVLLVDGDPSRRKLNAFGLRCAGFGVDEAADTRAARAQISRCYPNLLLMGVALLDLGVQAFVERLRHSDETREIPVLVLADNPRERDAESAREWGIDDYLAPPFSPEQFVARVNAAVSRGTAPADTAAMALSGLILDIDKRHVRKGNRVAALGPTDLRLLEFFIAHAERLIPRELLLFRIWGGSSSVSSRAVDVSVCRVRHALEQVGAEGLLQTVSRHGYRLSAASLNEPSRSDEPSRSS
jgi:two-component system phosphate regulon response regulator PhoB